MNQSTQKRRLPSHRLGLLADEQGAAMTETAIMLPSLILIWGGILYAFTLAQSIIEMNVQLRADSWTYAYSGCEGDQGESNFSTSSFDGGGDVPDLPILGSLMSLAFDENYSSREGSATAPSVLGGATNNYSTQQLWMCNESRDGWEIIDLAGGLLFSF